jgi:hypothetical protein
VAATLNKQRFRHAHDKKSFRKRLEPSLFRQGIFRSLPYHGLTTKQRPCDAGQIDATERSNALLFPVKIRNLDVTLTGSNVLVVLQYDQNIRRMISGNIYDLDLETTSGVGVDIRRILLS